MSEAAVPAFVLRGAEAEEAQAHMADTRSLERERRIGRLFTLLGPGGVIVVLTALVVSDRYERAHHPIPKPEMLVSMVRARGVSPAKPIDDLVPTEQGDVLASTVANYVAARESYCYTCTAKYSKHVLAVSAPEEKARYKAAMDPKNPESPAALYGAGLHAGVADVDPANVEVSEDPDSPNFFTAVFPVDIMTPNNPVPRRVMRYARMQWLPAREVMDPRDRQAYSPLGVGCWFYTSRIMTESAR